MRSAREGIGDAMTLDGKGGEYKWFLSENKRDYQGEVLSNRRDRVVVVFLSRVYLPGKKTRARKPGQNHRGKITTIIKI